MRCIEEIMQSTHTRNSPRTNIRNIFSKKYITKIISGREPDFDLSYMSKSKYFVQSGGGFSRIIADLVKVNNGIVLN